MQLFSRTLGYGILTMSKQTGHDCNCEWDFSPNHNFKVIPIPFTFISQGIAFPGRAH